MSKARENSQGAMTVPAGNTGAKVLQAQEVIALDAVKLVGPVGPTLTRVTGQAGGFTSVTNTVLQGTSQEINYRLSAIWTGTDASLYVVLDQGATPAGYSLKSVSGGAVNNNTAVPVLSGLTQLGLYVAAPNGVPVLIQLFVTYTKN